jgi:hypothetical protein
MFLKNVGHSYSAKTSSRGPMPSRKVPPQKIQYEFHGDKAMGYRVSIPEPERNVRRYNGSRLTGLLLSNLTL